MFLNIYQSSQSEENKSGNVLFISYLFPPVAGGGVQRSSKFVKYLHEFGWTPVVLTVKEPYDFYRDEELLQDVLRKSVIVRTHSIEPMKWVRKILKKKSELEIKSNSSYSAKKSFKPGFLVKLKTYILIPDNEILWLPFAIVKGIQLIKKYKPDLIYSTASPFTDHLIAMILKIKVRIPWVADFRDLWVDRPNFPKNKWRLFIDRKLEKMVIHNADHIITATAGMAEHFSSLYPDKKYLSITNGFDEEDFSETSSLLPDSNKFIMTYTGIFNKEQNPQKLLKAVKDLIDNNADFKNKVHIRIIGQLDNPGDFENLNYFNQLGLDKYSELVGYVSHRQVIKEMCKSTVLLLLIGEYPHNEGILTGKIFEYIRSGRPTLAVVPPNGLAANVINETNSGIIVSNESVEEISNGILKLFDLFISNNLEHSYERVGIEKYSRKNLTNQLSEVFKKLADQNNTQPK